ncbi:hypothetical protein K1719_024628 [Acacia pycnantha]|nr:hypothetical protein K1719_024628 [Acacia pycnantha]
MCKCRSHGTFPPLRPSKFSFEYLLLPPRSAPTAAPPGLAPQVLRRPPRPPTHRGLALAPTAGYRSRASAPSISGLVDSADERFARQYRCGPPPEFPLASPRSGIVHHLSGPDRYALTRTLHRRSRSVGGATHEGIPPVSFLAPYGFTRPLTRTHVRLLGPCFKTGRMGSSQADAGSAQVPRHAVTARAASHDRGDDVSAGISTARAWAAAAIRVGPRPESIGGPALTVPHPTRAHRQPHPLPSRQFQALFDSLFKVLFIFPSRYLFAIGLSPVFSLGRNLPPDWGCIPKQPDSPTAPRGATGSGHDGALTLSGAPFQGTWARSAAEDASPDYNSDAGGDRFSWWAVPGSLAVTRGILGPRPVGRRAHVRPRGRSLKPPWIVAVATLGPLFGQPGGEAPGRPSSATPEDRALAALRDARAACPRLAASGATCVQRLDGSRDSAIHTKYRISLRSSSMRAEISVAESRFGCTFLNGKRRGAGRSAPFPGRQRARLAFISVPWRLGRRGFGCRGRPRARLRPPPPYRRCSFQPVRGSLFLRGHDNDPSAGSPTETLLRLLLPLNDKVQWTSRDVAGGEPPTSPRSEHFTGPFNR